MAEAIGNSLNEPTTTLNGAILSGDNELIVNSASSLPNTGTFRIRIDDELITVGAISGTSLGTLGRGAEGTSATSHSNGADVNLVLTAEGLTNFIAGSALMTLYAAFSDNLVNYSLFIPFITCLPPNAPEGWRTNLVSLPSTVSPGGTVFVGDSTSVQNIPLGGLYVLNIHALITNLAGTQILDLSQSNDSSTSSIAVDWDTVNAAAVTGSDLVYSSGTVTSTAGGTFVSTMSILCGWD